MTRLILTTDSSGAGWLMRARIADLVIPLDFCFVWGPLPTPSDLATSLSMRSTQHDTALPHWLENSGRRHDEIRRKGLGLIELCQQCEMVELWVDPVPNAQLVLIWLLDYFRSHGKIASKLSLVQPDVRISGQRPEEVAKWRPPAVKILNDHLEAASMAWQAYRAPTPHDGPHPDPWRPAVGWCRRRLSGLVAHRRQSHPRLGRTAGLAPLGQEAAQLLERHPEQRPHRRVQPGR